MKQSSGQFAITSIESSNRLSNSVLSGSYVFDKVHQVCHVLDGATIAKNDGQASGDLVRAGETVFIPAGMGISLSFVDRYIRSWSFTSGDGLEALLLAPVTPLKVRSFQIMWCHSISTGCIG